MPQRKPLPHVERIRVKGRTYWYVKIKGRRLGRLPGDEGSAEWLEAYAALMRRHASDPVRVKHGHGTVGWLIAEYKRSAAYTTKAARTRESYDQYLQLLEPIAAFSATDVKRSHIRRIRSTMDGTPRKQHFFTQVASLLFAFGIRELDLEMMNPAAKMRREAAAESYAAWTEEQMAAFEASSPPPAVMTAYMIARYAGARRGDLVKLRRSDYDGSSLRIPGSKTETPVTVPVHPRLKTYLDSLPGALTLVAGPKGKPLQAGTLSKRAAKALKAAGLKGLSLHGLRHTAGRALAEAGCSPHEIAAVLGHKTLQMVQHYTRQAQQKVLAKAAIVKLRNRNET